MTLSSINSTAWSQAQLSAFQAAVQEATIRSFQTAKEAMSGDLQAQRLLAREAQAAQPTQYSPRTVPSWIIDRGALNVQALFAPRLYRSLTARCRQGRRSRL